MIDLPKSQGTAEYILLDLGITVGINLPKEKHVVCLKKLEDIIKRCVVNSMITDFVNNNIKMSLLEFCDFLKKEDLLGVLSNDECLLFYDKHKLDYKSKQAMSWYRYGNIPLLYLVGLLGKLNVLISDQEITAKEYEYFETYGSIQNIYESMLFPTQEKTSIVFDLYYSLYWYVREFPNQNKVPKSVIYEGFRAIGWVCSLGDYGSIDMST